MRPYGNTSERTSKVPEAITKLYASLKASIQALTQAILASVKAYKWVWAGGGTVVVAGVAVAVIVFGGFLGPSGKLICTASLTRARDYGVLSGSAALANNTAKSTDVKDRRKCSAQAGTDTFILTVDLKCKDLKKSNCLDLYSVEREDGLSLYQVRAVPDDEGEVAAGSIPPGAVPDAGAGDDAQVVSPAGQSIGGGAAPQQ